MIVGRDIRLSSELLAKALEQGLLDSGVDVYDIGLCGTEVVYFATFAREMDGGIMVTASHNPPDYNGMKFVREGSRPISGDNGLLDIRRIAERGVFSKPSRVGERFAVDIMPEYIEHLLTYVDRPKLKPLKVVVHAGNGGAGLIIDKLEQYLPFKFIKVHHEPDGTFPNGVPNPMLLENHAAPVAALRKHGADCAISWDGDYDRCFFFDEHGGFIEGYYIVGLLAAAFLQRHPGSRIVHDPRLTWNTLDIVQRMGGEAVQSKSGHAFIKETMREVDGVYGGEMSAHHYFRDFAYCDSGMIPWLLVTQLMCAERQDAVGAGRRAHAHVPGEWRDQPSCPRREDDHRRGARQVRADGPEHRPHRRRQRRVRPVAFQPALVEHRAADPPQRRESRQRGADARQDRRTAGPGRRRARLIST